MDADESYSAQDSDCHRSQSDDLASSLLNFTTTPVEFDLQSVKRQKTSRDPMSHRIIEKRRRDRMNNCLADLSRLIPTSYLKQGQGRIEKTEIIEMAIKHIKTLQAQVDSIHCQNIGAAKMLQESGSNGKTHKGGNNACCHERFYQGFKECQDETLNYFIEGEAMMASDPFCLRVMEHLSSVAQFAQSYTLTEDKHNLHADLDAKQNAGPLSSFRGSPSIPCQSSPDPMLPLLPMAGGMMVPASPIRDKHLRNLLAARALQQLEPERDGGAPQNKAGLCSTGETASLSSLPAYSTASSQVSSPQTAGSTVTSASSDASLSAAGKNWDGSMTEGVSSGYVSDISAVDRMSNSTGSGDMMKENNVMNIYKFKHNITKRFSQEGKVISRQYDGSSTSSREADEDHHHHGAVKYRSLKTKCRHASSSDSGPYSTSECSGAASTSSHESVEGSHDKKCRKLTTRTMGLGDRGGKGVECCTRSSMPLPGFVLHPSGTHYIPMSVCHNSLPDIFDTSPEAGVGPPVFHPISIPVHFRGPVISMPGSSISTVSTPCSSVSNSFSASPNDMKVMKKGQDL